mmetsp:Transcript_25630/g.46354  ORF Transcript_25630/g.46354 Transcript_25630/m.46354 type:complete len:218 (+) Transcript_25630:493-1146(+)
MVIVLLLDGLVQLARRPRVSSVHAHVHPLDLPPSAAPTNTFERKVCGTLHAHHGILRWVAYKGCDGLLVDDGCLIQSRGRPVRQILLEGDVGSEAQVGFTLVGFRGGCVAELDLVEPLDLPRADVARDDHSDGVAVIAGEVLAVHFVGEDDLAEAVDSLHEREGASIGVASFIGVVAFELNVLYSLWRFLFSQCDIIHVDPTFFQDIPEFDTSPLGR